MNGHRQGSLSALLAPGSVALVGASEDVARIGGRPLRYLREAGFKGAIYPVNPNRETVQGYKSYPSIASIPETPDVAMLAVPAHATVQAVRDCAAKGVRAAIVFSAGFAEADEQGRAHQEELSQIAKASGMRVLGPNCLGVFNSTLGYYGTFSAILDREFVKPGPVAVVSQSGAYGSHIAHLARERGLGISHWITTGNECDVDVAEALAWTVEQSSVNVVMAYAEGVRNGAAFIAALERARKLRKAIVFMKVGRSEVGAHAVQSHTAALAGADAVFDAVFRQYGVWRAQTTAAQLDVAYACARGIYPRANTLGIFTLSGGFGIQMADDASAAGLDVTPMAEDAQRDLKAMLPYASPRNPVDATAQALTDLPLMAKYIAAMLEKGRYTIFAGIFGSGPASRTFAASLREVIEAAAKASRGTIMALTMAAPTEVVRSYEEKGFLVHEDGSALMKALGALAFFQKSFETSLTDAPALEPAARVALTGGALSERAAKQILSGAGVAFLPEALVGPDEDAGATAAAIGFPVAIKLSSPDIAHKTEIGGVELNVKDAESARVATATILGRARSERPDARIEGVLVSSMAPKGVDIIAGVARDPAFGPIVVFGLGGIFVEVLKDVTFRVAPFDVDEARRMIREVRGYPILLGVRGAPPSDVEALAKLLSSLSLLAAANIDTIESIDLNPVRVLSSGKGLVALDALLVPVAAGA